MMAASVPIPEEEWIQSWKMKKRGSGSGSGSSSNNEQQPNIFKVADHIRETDPKAYEPRIVSIGPYHNDKPQVKAMVQVKEHYLQRFLHRIPTETFDVYLEGFSDWMAKARCCYTRGEIKMDDSQFKSMLLRDGCFIIELFLSKKTNSMQFGDPILGNMLTLSLVKFDLLLLENQLPFFIIQSLFNLVVPNIEDSNLSLLDITLTFFDGILPPCKNIFPPRRFYHLLHLFHSYFIARAPEVVLQLIDENGLVKLSASRSKAMLMTPCASDLMNANWRFNRELDESFKWDIPLKDEGRIIKMYKWTLDFRKGVITIWPARLDSNSNSFYRNLIAFEQYYFLEVQSRVMSYVMSMSCLINSEDDLELLRRKRIVEYTLDRQEATLFFRKLCKDAMVDLDKTYLVHLDDLSNKVWDKYDTTWNRYKANQKRAFFNDPIYIIYFIASVLFVIILTILQTVYTALGYYNSGHN